MFKLLIIYTLHTSFQYHVTGSRWRTDSGQKIDIGISMLQSYKNILIYNNLSTYISKRISII